MVKGFTLSDTQFIWNNDKQVGPHCANITEEVQLVQFGYYCYAQNPKNTLTPEQRDILSKVVPGAVYDGSADDPLSVAIRTHEKKRGGPQDGFVSPVHSASGHYGPNQAWILVALNNNMIDILGETWPRIDKHPKCPKALIDAAVRAFTYR